MNIIPKFKYKYNRWACDRYGKPDIDFSNVPYIVRVFPLFSPSIYWCNMFHNSNYYGYKNEE